MAQRAGSADLPLHGGQGPKWLADRMTRLGAVMSEVVSLVSLARPQKPRLRPFRHDGAVGLIRLELARGFSCKRYRVRAIALEVTQDLPSGIVAWRTGDAAP